MSNKFLTSEFFSNITLDRKKFLLALGQKKQGRLLALDKGMKRTGVSLSDPSRKIASQFGLLQKMLPPHKKDNFSSQAEAIIQLVRDEAVIGLVIGLPLNMNGGQNRQTQSAMQYARNLVKAGLTIPILLLDERLTSQAVDKLLADEKAMGQNLTTAKKNKWRDQMAASFLLQGLLDELNPLLRG